MHRFVRFAVPGAVLLLAVVAVAAQNAGTQVVGGDEVALREMVSRAFAAYPNYADQETTVYISRLPEDLPFELKLPDNMRVIGSIERGNHAPTEILLDARQSPEGVIQFFDDTLTGDEWRAVDSFAGGGFTVETSDSGFYCSATQDVMVSVSAFGYASGMSDVRLYVNSGASNICDGSAESVGYEAPFGLLPQLTAPAGVKLLQGGGSGGGGGPGFQSVSTQAMLESDLPLDAVLSAYNQQLEEAGWHIVGEESGDKLAWSGWIVESEDGQWAGTLTFTSNPTADNQYMAVLSIMDAPDTE